MRSSYFIGFVPLFLSLLLNILNLVEFSTAYRVPRSLIARQCYCPASADELFDYYDEPMLAVESPGQDDPSQLRATMRSLDKSNFRLFRLPVLPSASKAPANDGTVENKSNTNSDTKQESDKLYKQNMTGRALPIKAETSTSGSSATSSKSKVNNSLKSQARYYNSAINAYNNNQAPSYYKANNYASYGRGVGYAPAFTRQRPQHEQMPYRQAHHYQPQQGQYNYQHKYTDRLVAVETDSMGPVLYSKSSSQYPATTSYQAYPAYASYRTAAPANAYQTGYYYGTPPPKSSDADLKENEAYERPNKVDLSKEPIDRNNSALVEPSEIDQETTGKKSLEDKSLKEAMSHRVGHFLEADSKDDDHDDKDKGRGREETDESSERAKSAKVANGGGKRAGQDEAEEEDEEDDGDEAEDEVEEGGNPTSSEQDSREALSSAGNRSDNKGVGSAKNSTAASKIKNSGGSIRGNVKRSSL